MNDTNFVALDLAVSHTTLEAQSGAGRVLRRLDLPTERSALVQAVKSIRRPRCLVIEEGTLADWVYRMMLPYVDDLIVCDPRHNRYISEGDKEDTVDARKLCELARWNALRPVHHPRRQSRIDQRRWVWLHDQTARSLRAVKNQIKAAYRYCGVFATGTEVYSVAQRQQYLDRLPSRAARRQQGYRYELLDKLTSDRHQLYRQMQRLVSRYPLLERFLEIPGFGVVRAMTFWVVVDTPFRFKTVQKLWSYAGLGIERDKSGLPRPGRPYSNGPTRLNRSFNAMLKNVAKGAAQQAITTGDNPFAEKYDQLIARGLSSGNARTTVARKCLAVPWAMWKTGARYNAELV